eukprot:6232760-Pyramimonas_sp.AAC.1
MKNTKASDEHTTARQMRQGPHLLGGSSLRFATSLEGPPNKCFLTVVTWSLYVRTVWSIGPGSPKAHILILSKLR